ncbi:uncharacterized protein LOC133332227 [Musca vetustissima]|uniref:uncharacterized protein LOC133332227 n=1 Tax=Musca vetustissima TaxID=27455 RepID=UPI002AB6219C|nr:uncharacterized protein LOC133332227 [Musca vetustissima]
MFLVKVLLVTTIVATLTSDVSAIHCYQCASLGNKKCGEPFEAEDNMKYDCNKAAIPIYLQTYLPLGTFNATGCMTQTVEAPLGGGTHIIRSCYFGDTINTDNGCKLDPKSADSLDSCYVCTKDWCNGSSPMTQLGASILVLLALTQKMF